MHCKYQNEQASCFVKTMETGLLLAGKRKLIRLDICGLNNISANKA